MKKTKSKNQPRRAQSAKRPAKAAAPAKRKAADPGANPGKGASIIALIKRSGGASLKELMEASGWQAHSVRGFISTSKKGGLNVKSAMVDGARTYSAH